jgi:hypothetical protein
MALVRIATLPRRARIKNASDDESCAATCRRLTLSARAFGNHTTNARMPFCFNA